MTYQIDLNSFGKAHDENENAVVEHPFGKAGLGWTFVDVAIAYHDKTDWDDQSHEGNSKADG